MTSLIINMPHLQNRRQRYGALLLSALCWAWFLMPLLVVSGWLLGFRVLAQEVVWLGGWKSLLQLTEVALTLVVGLTGAWLLWTLVRIQLDRRPGVAPTAPTIDATTLLGANIDEVEAAVGAKVATVTFTADGQVARVLAEGRPITSKARPVAEEERWLAAS
jgi:poly-beta-1,6-N-acetyl-D-glucosamine biosynthesis protein PgaD